MLTLFYIAVTICMVYITSICLKAGNEVAENYKSSTQDKVYKIICDGKFREVTNFYCASDSLGYFHNMYGGGLKYYINKRGDVLAQGAFIVGMQNTYLLSSLSVYYADVEHMHQTKWNDELGEYEAVTSNGDPVGNYFTYTPKFCAHCGKPLPHREQIIDPTLQDVIDTSVLADSQNRYCDECNKRFNNKTETYYNFAIDTLNKKLITFNDKKEWLMYMRYVQLGKMCREKGYTFLGGSLEGGMASATGTLHECQKNEEMAIMWDTVKACL